MIQRDQPGFRPAFSVIGFVVVTGLAAVSLQVLALLAWALSWAVYALGWAFGWTFGWAGRLPWPP